MSTLLSKARVAVLGNLHALLDRAVDTPEGYAQYIRDLETGLADMRAAHDESVGSVNGYAREITKLQSENAQKQSDIDLLLGDDDESNDQAALQMQVKVQHNQDQITELQQLQAAAQAEADELADGISKLDAKHTEMVNNLRRITMKSAASKTRNRAAAAVETASQASSAAGSVDNIEDKIDHENDVSKVRFDRVFGQLQGSASPEEQADLARAKAAIDARRTEIAQAAKQEPAT